MLELAILGFLRAEALHGYRLKQRLQMLTGHFRPVSDGALYPAIARLERQGLLTRRTEAGISAAQRQVLALTPEGETALIGRLRSPSEVDISDRNHFFTLLAFLKYLPASDQRAVLARRLAFLEAGRSFFLQADRPMSQEAETDTFRRGMLHIARATSQVEKAWIIQTLKELDGEING